MPIDALKTIPVEQSDKPFNRLALRCAMTATLNNNAVSVGAISIVAQRYRKINRTSDGVPILDFCDRDDASSDLVATFGENADSDELIRVMARRCRNYAFPGGGSATVELAFSNYRKAGDLYGTLKMTVVQNGTPVDVASADTAADGAANPAFGDFHQSLFGAIKNRSDLLGW